MLKKKLCNPPVEEVARVGDAELLGLFIGAGRAVDSGSIKDKETLWWYVNEVTKCEAAYLAGRKALAAEHTKTMRYLESELLEKAGEGY